MTKQEVLDLVDAKKMEMVAMMDALRAAVDSMEMGGDLSALQAQIAELGSQVAALQADKQALEQIVAVLSQKIEQIRSILAAAV